MPHYLIQTAYTSEGWAALVKNPHDRLDAVRPMVEAAGGQLESAYFAFGEYDVIAIAEFPDNVSAAGFAIAAAAGGAVRAFRTTPLLTSADGVEAMRKAGGAGYSPPR